MKQPLNTTSGGVTPVVSETDIPRVSVIIPTYNRAGVVSGAIRSMLGQTLSEIEVIVVDDGSSDHTPEVVASFRDGRVRYLRHETNKGVAAARNSGIRAARGEFLAFLDDDDQSLPERLQRQVHAIEASSLERPGVAVCAAVSFNEGRPQFHVPRHRGWIHDRVIMDPDVVIAAPTLLVRRLVTDPPILFDESLPAAEDWDYMIRLSKLCQVEAVPEILVQAIRHPGAHLATMERTIEGREAILRKYAKEPGVSSQTLASHHIRLAKMYHRRGRGHGLRWHLLGAFRANPLNLRYLLWFLGACLGGIGFRATMKLFPGDGR